MALRESSEKVREMLKELEVMQQPSGFVDSIIMSWRIEAQMQEWPQALRMRDLHAAALSTEAKRVAWLAHQVPCWVAGKMTAALQVADAHIAFPP